MNYNEAITATDAAEAAIDALPVMPLTHRELVTAAATLCARLLQESPFNDDARELATAAYRAARANRDIAERDIRRRVGLLLPTLKASDAKRVRDDLDKMLNDWAEAYAGLAVMMARYGQPTRERAA